MTLSFFNDLPVQPKQPKLAIRRDQLILPRYPQAQRKIATEPWPLGDEVIFDVECYKNFFMCGVKHIKSQSYMALYDPKHMSYILWGYKVIGFNSISYDVPMIEAAIKGASLADLKYQSDDIILRNERYNIKGRYNHIDLIEVAPLSDSLKTYAGRLHAKRMQDLPFEPHELLDEEQQLHTADYCFNDLDNTELLLEELRPSISLREHLSKVYGGEDLRSRSDAQLAQVIMNGEIERLTGYMPRRPKSQVGREFKFTAPPHVHFRKPELQKMLAEIQDTVIAVGASGHVEVPKTIEGRKVNIAGKLYTIGMGGLHSNEKKVGYVATDEVEVCDVDVTGYYPNLINTNNVHPAHIGPVYNQALQGLVDRRETAKRNKDSVTSDSLKIGTNGVFGKSSDPYSTLYDPAATVMTTLSGQLSLLMEIEWIEEAGFEVISANTDGIVVLVPVKRRAEFDAVIRAWEQHTRLRTEETKYKGLWSRDVNAYIALKPDGKWKEKGAYCERGSALNSPLSRNPEHFVVVDAVKAFIAVGTPLRETIESCTDMRRFVSIRKASGGAHKDGVYLGKVIRWYYAEGATGAIYKLNGDKVGKTDDAKPLMEMDGLEPDINYDWYVNAAEQMLFDIGFYKREKERTLL